MKKLLTVLIVGILAAGSAFAADDAPTRLIKKYLDLAEELSVARTQDLTCEVRAYPDEIIGLVESASYIDGFDPSQVGPVTRDQFKDSLRFRQAIGEFKQWEVKTAEQWAKTIVGTSFNSPPNGVYGSLKRIELLPNGKLKQSEVVFDDAGNYKLVTTHGAWSVQVKDSSQGQLVRVAFTLPNKDGKAKTEVYRLGNSQDDYKTWILHVKPKADSKAGEYENIRFWNQIVGECEA